MEELSWARDPGALSKSLAGAPPGTQGEIFVRTVFSRQVRFNNNEFEGTSLSKNTSTTLRLIGGGKMSVAQSSRVDAEALTEMVGNAVAALPFGTPVGYDFPGPAEVKPLELYSNKVPDLSLKELVDIAEDLLQTVRKYDPAIRASSGAGFEEVEVSLHNTAGFFGSYKKTVYRVGLGGQLIQGDDFLRFGEYRTSWTNDVDYEELKKEVIQQFEWARNVVPFTAGTYPVVFAPQQVGFLMTPFLACLNGKAFARGISPLKEKLGEKLVDERITLVDDGTLPREVSSAPFDREGVLTRRNILIDRGVPREILLDLQTSRELGRESTGNGTGSGPSPHHVLLEPGDKTLDEIVKGIDLGLIIFGSMGAWTGNPYSGNVSGTISLGLKIEHGKIVGRVKNCMFSVNSFTHFRDHLMGLSRETKRSSGGGPGGGATTLPYAALDEVVISTR